EANGNKVGRIISGVPLGSATVNVVAAAADHYAVATSAANPDVAGEPFSVTVTAQDSYGNAATGYTGTVHFSSTDPQATLPADYTFTAADNGAHAFSGVVFRSAGDQTLTASSGVIGAGSATVTVALPVVTTDADSGPGPTRQAALGAHYLPGAVIIFAAAFFATPRTIPLTSGELAITDSMTIAGPAGGVTVSGNNASRVFDFLIPGGGNVAISDMTIT